MEHERTKEKLPENLQVANKWWKQRDRNTPRPATSGLISFRAVSNAEELGSMNLIICAFVLVLISHFKSFPCFGSAWD